MSNKSLNLIALNIPYPADYGGVIDIFYKIKSLAGKGIKIHLHCFHYGRNESKKLEELCEKVYYYKRKKNLLYFFSLIPFIVITRSNRDLLQNLKKNNFPILFDGIHASYFLNYSELKSRKKLLRHHNVEHKYYFKLTKSEKNIFEKFYLYAEALKLKTYFKKLKSIDYHLAISENDKLDINKTYNQTVLIPAFHANDTIKIIAGKSDYILYHGNLSVAENINAVTFLIREIFSKIEHEVIIAGKNPAKSIKYLTAKYKNIRLVSNPDFSEMQDLVQNAQINVLFTFQSTGLKLKLMNAVFNGRFCIVNDDIIENTGLESVCTKANSPDEIIDSISSLIHEEFRVEMIEKRKYLLESLFSNDLNAQKIIELL